jgi:hypothetical protein
MPSFSGRSKEKLASCHVDLQKVFNEVIKHVDCTVTEGHRGEERQEKLFTEGKTQLHYPNGRHNSEPSFAVDVAPYDSDIRGIPWKDREVFHLFAGYVLATARQMGIVLRWGGDWDGDFKVSDNKFDDFPHFEIKR